MIKKSLIILLVICSVISCTTNKKPKVVYRNTTESKKPTELKKDTTLVEIADLPILIDSTNYLMHPIGNIRIYRSNSKFISKSRDYNNTNFIVSNSSQYQITGDLTNIKFQHLDSDKLIPLTEKTLKIQSVTFLKKVFDQTKSKYLLYDIIDQDTNMDQTLDYQDLKSLYISKVDGTDFTKLTPDYQELVNWKVVLSKNRLYFKTVEDIDKDGEFNKTDIIHYQYVDLEDKNWQVTEYFPL